MATIMNGAKVAREFREDIARIVGLKGELGKAAPVLAVIYVGNNKASERYVNNKEKDCVECGIECRLIHLEEDSTTNDIAKVIDGLNNDDTVDGIILQLPLAEHCDELELVNKIKPDKDMDKLSVLSAGALRLRGTHNYAPCTPLGIMMLLRDYDIDPAGKTCVIIGRSNLVGLPLASLMTSADATVTVCHSKTPDLAKHCREADILVSAAGKQRLVTADMVKDGAVVIDVGINVNEDGKLCGDVCFDEVAEKASYITPVPGGVGPMTRAMLLWQVVSKAYNL